MSSAEIMVEIEELRSSLHLLSARIIDEVEFSIRVRDCLNAATDLWVWEIDHNLNHTFASRGIFRALGVTEIEGRHFFALSHFRHRSPDLINLHDRMQEKSPFQNVLLAVTDAQGETRSVSFSGAPWFDDGEFAGYRGTAVIHNDGVQIDQQRVVWDREYRDAVKKVLAVEAGDCFPILIEGHLDA